VIAFTFEGAPCAALPGQTIAAALLAAGHRTLRTTRFEQRPRGVFCGIGACFDCLVVHNGRAGTRACITPVRAGDVVERQRGSGPARAAVASQHRSGVSPERHHEHGGATVDVLVVGGGPAGLSAARAAAEAGARVVLVDGGARLGGQFFRRAAPELPAEPDRHARAGARLLDAVTGDPAIAVLERARVWRMERLADGTLRARLTGSRRAVTPPARVVVLAPGAHDRPLPFPGWDLPGVMTAGGAQALVKGSRVRPGRRVLVAGTGPFLLPVSAQLVRSGARVVGVLEARSDVLGAWVRRPAALPAAALKLGEALSYLRVLRAGRVPLRAGWGVAAVRPGLDGQVAEADIAALDASWTPRPQTLRTLRVDAVCAGYGFVPALELALELGCAAVTDALDRTPVIAVDRDGRSSVREVFVAGEATGIGGASLAQVEGEIAGAAAAAQSLRRTRARDRRGARARRAALGAFAAAVREVHAVPAGWADALPDNTTVCRCEEVTAGDIRAAVDDLGASDPRSVKLLCRAGMGLCQGRMCAANAADVIGAAAGRDLTGDLSLLSRPIAEPVPLGELAG
jgi:NADPH-dependent 2,4-dienoyl-CoA reductase/sulfur reductase-like enzyme